MKPSVKALVGVAVAAVAAISTPVSVSAQDPTDPDLATLASSVDDLSTLVTAVTAAGLAEALADCDNAPFSNSEPVTVFAPTNDAFAALPEAWLTAALGDPDGLLTAVLSYHVVPGYLDAAAVTAADSLTTLQGADIAVDGTTLNGSIEITGADAGTACNGIVHLIDGVLIPPLPSIGELAADTESLSSLVTGLTAAGLVAPLSDCATEPFSFDEPITVFAPTNEAFAALPAATLEAALADPDGLLTTVLTYHVVPGLIGSAAVVESDSLTTAQGEAISVDGTVLNGSVNIVETDTFGCNGVVHVIDAVLLPPSLAPATTTAPTTAAPTVPPVDELPPTGNETTVMALVAGLLVLGGAVLIGTRRRPA